MSMTSAHGPAADKDEMIEMLRVAHELGVTHFDTAEAYGHSRTNCWWDQGEISPKS